MDAETIISCMDIPLHRAPLSNVSRNATHSGGGGRGSAHEWFAITIPTICILGVIGNGMTVVVLTRRRLLSSMDRLEKSANYGLIALAFSDMMFCVLVFPQTFITEMNPPIHNHLVYQLYYKIYGSACINLFLMISTWLIVAMAVNRYIVVIYPFRARQTLGTRRTLCSLLLVYIGSLIFTLPFFLHVGIYKCKNNEMDLMFYFNKRWHPDVSDVVRFYIRWIWPIFADFIPVLVLAWCNTHLIRELRAASINRRRTCQGQQVKDSGQKVTLTLVIIVLMLLLLVSPSEILRYVDPYRWGEVGILVAMITNTMQALNFALNFVLYCVVNANFRNTIKAMCLCCENCKHHSHSGDITSTSQYKHTKMTQVTQVKNGIKTSVLEPDTEVELSFT